MPRPDVSDERIPQILDAAAMTFSRNGIDGASMNQIALAAEVSKATLYHYFQNKEALVEALVRRLFEQDQPEIERLRQRQQPATERLRAYAEALVALLTQHQHLYPIFAESYAAAARRASLQAILRGYFETYTAAFTDIIQQGINQGELRSSVDAAAAAVTLVAVIEGSILIAHNLGQSLEEVLLGCVQVVLTGLQP